MMLAQAPDPKEKRWWLIDGVLVVGLTAAAIWASSVWFDPNAPSRAYRRLGIRRPGRRRR